MKRILVLRGGALGDLIVTLPALALLRRQWPDATIELAGNPTAGQLAVGQGLVSSVHSQHERRWIALYGFDPLPPALRAWLDAFDLIVNYWPDPEGELSRRFPTRPAQRYLSTSALPASAPAAAHYCAPLAELGLATRDCHFRLRTAAPSLAAPARPVLIHPGSGSARKNWPRERWLDLMRHLEFPAALVLGEAESETWRDITLPGIQRLEGRSLDELIVHFATCRLFVGHDSGVSHLAAASGARCLLLFGPTDPAVWAPPGAHIGVIRRDSDLNSISVPEVQRELASALATRG